MAPANPNRARIIRIVAVSLALIVPIFMEGPFRRTVVPPNPPSTGQKALVFFYITIRIFWTYKD
jgi:hypothetical protein